MIPKLFGKKGSGAYWSEYDWKKSVAAGMSYAGLTFSGEHDFVETSYVFPTTHMVAPKESALSCSECHTRDGSRLAGLTGFYMPGRDRSKIIDYAGWLVVFGSLGGATLHGLGRFFASNGRRGRK